MPFFENAEGVHLSGCSFTETHGNMTEYNAPVHNGSVFHGPVYNAPVDNAPVNHYYGTVHNRPRAPYNEDSYEDAGGEHMGWYGDRSYNNRGMRPHMTVPVANYNSPRRPRVHQNRANTVPNSPHAAPGSVHPEIVEARQLLAELEREKLRDPRFRGGNRTSSEFGEEVRENRTRPARGVQHRQHADHEGPTHSNFKPASSRSASMMTPVHPEPFVELGRLVGEFRGMRLGNAPPSIPGDINPRHEYEAGEGDEWIEYSDGGVWGGDDDGPYTDDRWSSTPPTSPGYPIPTPLTPPVSPPPPPVGINTRAPRTRRDPVTQTTMHHGPVHNKNSKNITTNDTRDSYNNSSINIRG